MTDERSVEDIAKDVFSECSNVGELFITEIVRALRIERNRADDAEAEVELQDKQREKLVTLHLEEERKLKDEIIRLKDTIENLHYEVKLKHDTIDDLKAALKAILKHQEIVSGKVVHLSATYAIAKQALENIRE